MKSPIVSFFVVALALGIIDPGYSQEIEPIPIKKFYKDRVTRNLKLLCKEAECMDNIVINDRGLYMYPTSQRVDKPEFILYWREMSHFNELLKEKSNEEIIEILKRKGQRYFHGIKSTHVDPAKYPISEFGGLKVAIDPGHVASNMGEAILERRYVRVEGKHLNQKKDIEFFEANLAYTTSLRLKEMLEDKGAQVMLTHKYGKSAMGINYYEWLETDYKKDIIEGYKSEWYNREKFNHLMSGDAPDFVMFYDVFRNKDFVARAKAINKFRPHLTVVIHYNASEGGQRYGDKYLPPVTENYSMVFVPGSFLGFEVDGADEIDQRFELLRLLVSYDLEESNVFASNVIKELDQQLKVDALPPDNGFEFAEKYAIKSDLADGVYHRNFYLTRVVKGPIAYTEALYQDNFDEIKLLGKKDYTIEGIRTSSRVKDVAQVYFSAIENWLDYNKVYTKKLDALFEDKFGDEEIYEAELKENASEND